jgi:sec-independent protein translocase protein TatA
VFRNIQGPELLIILLIIVLLFGARKLPETARGLGRSLRIFKAETKGLTEDDAGTATQQAAPAAPREITSEAPAPAPAPPAGETSTAQPAPSPADERA